MFKNLGYYWRLLYIGYVLRKYRVISIFGKLNLQNKNNNIANALEELGPAFIKLGQFLSTRPDLIGAELADSLSYLRDKLPCFSFDIVRTIILSEFGKNLEQIYSSFNKMPVAAASIAQVHQAITLDGDQVAVKVRRPNIDKILIQEIGFFYFIARLLNKKFPQYKRLKLLEVVKTIETSFKFELDLSFEAAAAAELLEQNKLGYVYIPKVNWLWTGNKIFTMEWIDATSIYEREKLIAANLDLTSLAKNFAIMFFNQAFVNGFFHADLHQGNIMVNNQGQIILLDFGIMGRLDYKNRLYIAQILHGFLNQDYDLIARIHKQAGYINKNQSVKQFAQACRAIGEPIMNLPPEQISIARLLGQLFKITEDFQMETQPQLILLQKTMIMVEGIGKILCPEANLWHLAEDWIKLWAQDNLSVEARSAKLIKHIFKKVVSKFEHELDL